MLSRDYLAQICSVLILSVWLVPAAALASQDSQLKVAKGVAALEKGHTDVAIRFFEGAVTDDPEDSDGWFYLGQTRNMVGNFAGAVRALNKVDATLWSVHFDLGFAYYQLGDYAQVVTAMARTLKEDATRSEARFYLGVALYRLDRYQKAVKYLNDESRFSSDLKPWAMLYSGLASRKLKNTKEAEATFGSLKKKYPEAKATQIAIQVTSGVAEDEAAENAEEEGKDVFSLITSLGQVWDSNPGLVQDDVDVASQFGAAALTQSAGAMRTQVALDLGVRLGSDTVGWRVGGSLYQGIHELNSDATDFNVFSGRVATGLEIEQKNWDLDVDLHLVRTLLGLWDGYSTTLGIGLGGGVIAGANRVTVDLELENQTFDTEAPRDGTLLALPIGYMRMLAPDLSWTVSGTLTPSLYGTKDPGSEYAYGGLGVGLSTSIRPVEMFRAAVSLDWSTRSYSNDAIYPPENTLQSRKDNEIRFGLLAGLTTGAFFANGTFNVARNSSIALYTYTRTVTGLDLGYRF